MTQYLNDRVKFKALEQRENVVMVFAGGLDSTLLCCVYTSATLGITFHWRAITDDGKRVNKSQILSSWKVRRESCLSEREREKERERKVYKRGFQFVQVNYIQDGGSDIGRNANYSLLVVVPVVLGSLQEYSLGFATGFALHPSHRLRFNPLSLHPPGKFYLPIMNY